MAELEHPESDPKASVLNPKNLQLTLSAGTLVAIVFALYQAFGMWNKATASRWTCEQMRTWVIMVERDLDMDLPDVTCNGE